MINNKSKKGFTLIEMLVVIAVISILAGITLTGIGGFTSRARDTRRIGDIKSLQNSVEIYSTKCGFYPGAGLATSAAGCTTSILTWANFSTALANVGAKVPNDPTPSQTYLYAWNGAGTKYILGALLENDNKALSDPDQVRPPLTGFTSTTGASTTCAYTAGATGPFGYCIGS